MRRIRAGLGQSAVPAVLTGGGGVPSERPESELSWEPE
jgi:hypothetical protein